jgi:integrase
MTLTATTRAFDGQHNVIERDVRLICERTGVPYLSPHKLRHGHVVHALKQARNLSELKGISQNIMHSSVVITDQVYGQFTHSDVKNIIANLGASQPEVGDQLSQLLALLNAAKAKGLL